jgi:uncharacterized repeat protein (TIGR02543 family)
VKDPNQTGYTTHDTVVVTATADSGWDFTGWTGDIISDTNPLQITMENSTTLTATFTTESFPLTVNVIGQGDHKESRPNYYPSGSA